MCSQGIGWVEGQKKGGGSFHDGVYHEGGSLTAPAALHSAPPPHLETLQIKFLTLEFGRTPSDPSKGPATPSARPKHCPAGCGKAASQPRSSVAYDVGCGGCWPAMAL